MQQKLILLISLLFLSNISLIVSDCVKVHKLDNGMCGELCLSKYISSFAIKFGGVTEGNCKDINFTIFDHKESVSIGSFGSFEVDIYRKEEKSLKILLVELFLLPLEVFKSVAKFLNEENNQKSFIKKVLLGYDVTVYKITDGLCGELQLSSNIVSFAEKFGGVTEGNCYDIGFTFFDHTESISVGPFGNYEVKIYRKN